MSALTVPLTTNSLMYLSKIWAFGMCCYIQKSFDFLEPLLLALLQGEA